MATNATQASPEPPSPTLEKETADRLAGIRILRLAAIFISGGYLAYGVVAVPAIVDSLSVMQPWWTILAVAAVFVPGLGLGIVGWWSSARRLRSIAAAAVCGYAVAVATWWWGWSGGSVNITTGIWFSMFFGMAALAATLAFRARYAFAVLVVVATVSTVINHRIRPPELNSDVLPDIAWGVGFSLVFVAAVAMVVTTADLLDSSRDDAYAATAEIAAAQARAIERDRFDALTHDSVMATLLLAARNGASAELAQHARTAIAEISQAATLADDPVVSATEAATRIREAVDLVDPSIAVEFADLGPSTTPLPGLVVAAVAAACAEAVRNSKRHGGVGSSVAVTMTLADNGLDVTVADDGVGFVPGDVPDTRFGIAVSIHGRMARLPGGTADIRSAPGTGTVVELRWRR